MCISTVMEHFVFCSLPPLLKFYVSYHFYYNITNAILWLHFSYILRMLSTHWPAYILEEEIFLLLKKKRITWIQKQTDMSCLLILQEKLKTSDLRPHRRATSSPPASPLPAPASHPCRVAAMAGPSPSLWCLARAQQPRVPVNSAAPWHRGPISHSLPRPPTRHRLPASCYISYPTLCWPGARAKSRNWPTASRSQWRTGGFSRFKPQGGCSNKCKGCVKKGRWSENLMSLTCCDHWSGATLRI